MSNSLDPDQVLKFMGPDLGPNCLQKLLAEDGPRHEKTFLQGVTNDKGADQPAHPGSLISAFVIRLFESIIVKLAASKLSLF